MTDTADGESDAPRAAGGAATPRADDESAGLRTDGGTDAPRTDVESDVPRTDGESGGLRTDGGTETSQTDGGAVAERRTVGRATELSALDRTAYALFARHADGARHERDRRRYRGAAFDVFLARVYGLSWLVAVAVGGLGAVVGSLVGSVGPVPGVAVVVLAGVVCGAVAKHGTIRAASVALRVQAATRRSRIRRTLPGAAQYLHALSSGADDARTMLRRVAETDAYGETARAIRAALHTAELTGSLRRGLERVARETPASQTLGPFLRKFREHAQQGEDALAEYLRLESRMLTHRRERARDRNADAMELVGELFVVLLVLPALLVVVVTVMSVLAPGLSRPIPTPFGSVTGRALAAYGSAAFVLAAGAGGATVVQGLRPTHRRDGYDRPGGVATVLSAGRNPASATIVVAPAAVAVAVAAWLVGTDAVNAVLAGYVAFGVPVGAVAWRRARIDDAKDRRLADFVHGVSGHVGLGRPLSRAVTLVARDVNLGPLDGDVADLAFNLRTPRRGADTQTAALARFRERVGTPLAAQTVGLLTGALDAGSDTDAVFETLRTEVGRLHHQKRALRANMLVYVAVGWTTALLVVGIVLAVDTQVIDSFTQLSQLSGTEGFSLDAGAVQPDRARERFYLVTQATVIASGWFAGAADRGWYAALLHSGALVAITGVAFWGVGA
ncbi:MAG: type II secretion system F family protein [Halobaculum sp.]